MNHGPNQIAKGWKMTCGARWSNPSLLWWSLPQPLERHRRPEHGVVVHELQHVAESPVVYAYDVLLSHIWFNPTV
eukprot:1502565-Amphidinium_carterae.1